MGWKISLKVATRSDRHSGLPKRPITKYYLHNLQLHNLPLRQSYFPPTPNITFVERVSDTTPKQQQRIQFRDGKSLQSLTTHKVANFPPKTSELVYVYKMARERNKLVY